MKEFINVVQDGKKFRRETDTFDTFFESSWYFARFASFDNKNAMLDERAKYWLPVDQYIGGIDHAVLHLLYSRFFYRCLRDLGFVEDSEPFLNLLCQGMILKDGKKMSKSKGNVVDPNEMVEKYGADAVRLCVMFAAPPKQSFEWSDQGLHGASKFLNRIWNLVQIYSKSVSTQNQDFTEAHEAVLKLRNKTHKTLSKVKDDLNRRHSFNTAIASIMELTNSIPKDFLSRKASVAEKSAANEAINNILIMLSPITPHITHFLWKQMGNDNPIIDMPWPEANEELLKDKKLQIVIQINGKLRASIEIADSINQNDIETLALDNENIKKHLTGKEINKFVYVQDKLLNIVTS